MQELQSKDYSGNDMTFIPGTQPTLETSLGAHSRATGRCPGRENRHHHHRPGNALGSQHRLHTQGSQDDFLKPYILLVDLLANSRDTFKDIFKYKSHTQVHWNHNFFLLLLQ